MIKRKLKILIYDSNRCNIKAYQGPINDFDFEHQTNNYLNLVKSLEPFNIKLTDIWYGKFTDDCNANKSHFVVKSEDGNFIGKNMKECLMEVDRTEFLLTVNNIKQLNGYLVRKKKEKILNF